MQSSSVIIFALRFTGRPSFDGIVTDQGCALVEARTSFAPQHEMTNIDVVLVKPMRSAIPAGSRRPNCRDALNWLKERLS
jgi:hypothetical protein